MSFKAFRENKNSHENLQFQLGYKTILSYPKIQIYAARQTDTQRDGQKNQPRVNQ